MTILAFLAALLAFGCLALSMERHHRDIFHKHPSRSKRRGLRIAGWMGLTLSFILAIAAWGAAIGGILWFGLLSLAAAITLLAVNRFSASHRGAPPSRSGRKQAQESKDYF